MTDLLREVAINETADAARSKLPKGHLTYGAGIGKVKKPVRCMYSAFALAFALPPESTKGQAICCRQPEAVATIPP